MSRTMPPAKRALCRWLDRHAASLARLADTIHAHPELGYQEHRASALLAQRLVRGGFDVLMPYAGMETAFRAEAVFQDEYDDSTEEEQEDDVGRPRVALLAEYDALPGLGHACGHNLIGTSAVGAALGLKDAWPELPGQLLVAGSPAEETGGGKVFLVEAGVFDGVAAAMMVHPSVRTRVVASMISLEELVVRYHGKSAHASSRPFDGINALDALVLAYTSVAALRQHIRPDARVHGIITDGGRAPNIVPDYAAGHFYVRAGDDAYLDDLRERVLGCFRAGAEATGARLECTPVGKRYSAMRSNPTLAGLFRANLAALGIEESPPDPNRSSGSSDMGNVSAVVPALHPSLAIAPPEVPGHSPAFAEYAGSPAGQEGLVQAAKAMAMTAVDLLERPDLAARMREQFASGQVAPPQRAF